MGSVADLRVLNRRSLETLPPLAIAELKTYKFEVILHHESTEDMYKAAINRFNKAWIREAGAISFCESELDVAACLSYVQRWNVDLAIACGRHSYYGASSVEKGLVIDLKKMNNVTIDKKSMTCTAGGGCRAIDLETPLQAEGLSVVMGAVNDTGIGGLTLGGGSGFLTGQYGLVCDNLIAATVVTADGRVLEASDSSNPDLFWAIRGGGSNFGVVTQFKYRVHKQGDVYAGPLIFTSDKVKPFLELADTFDQLVELTDGKLAIFTAFKKGPHMAKVHPVALVFYDGPEEEAKKLISPLLELGPIVNLAGIKKFAEITYPSEEWMGPADKQRYSTSNVLMHAPLQVSTVETLIKDFDIFFDKYGSAVSPSKFLIEFRCHAKTLSISTSATAIRARRKALTLAMEVQYNETVSDDVIRQEVKAMIGKVKSAVHKGGDNFTLANIADGQEKVADMFGENLPRLRELKRKYDPKCVFNKWFPIAPAEG